MRSPGEDYKGLEKLLRMALGSARAQKKGVGAYEHAFTLDAEGPVAVARWLNRDPLLPEKGAQAKDPKSHRFYYQAGDHQKEEQFPEPGDICQVCSRPRGEHVKVCGLTDSPSMDWLATYLKNLGLEEARKGDP